jgi:hypothetical protein
MLVQAFILSRSNQGEYQKYPDICGNELTKNFLIFFD